jgi:SAM-dependent methyltransferase
VGADVVPGKNVDVVLPDIYSWRAFRSNSFDVVVSGQTLEHVEFPWLTVGQIARVLKPGGRCCVIAPSSGPEHRFPVDCWRLYPDGARALARYAGLDVVEAETLADAVDSTGAPNVWHDTVLIAEKPATASLRAGLVLRVRRVLSRAALPRPHGAGGS